jgi:hypothetical protein
MKKALTALAVLSLGISCACAPPSEVSPTETPTATSQFTNWPSMLNDFRFHWSAAPQIDVTKAPAMVVRAYLEAYDTAWFTLSMDNAYPGFLDATPENQEPDANSQRQLTHIRPLGAGITKTARDARPHFGYQVFHLSELDEIADGYRAIVCVGEYAHFVESTAQPGKFIAIGTNDTTAQPFQPDDSGVYAYRIEFKEHGGGVGRNPSPPVTTPQSGPAPAPENDVFGSWFFTGASMSGWGPAVGPDAEQFPSPELQQRCENAMPMNREQRIAMMTGYKDQPPAHGEAIPGWPTDSK